MKCYLLTVELLASSYYARGNMSKAIRNKFGKQVRNLRRERRWSQEDLADNSGVHRTYIGAIERGEQNVSIDNIIKLAKALDVSLEQLFKGL